MGRPLVAALLALVLVAAVPPHAGAPSREASFTEHRYQAADPKLSRDYWVYVPSSTERPRPALVVYLHGCNQDGPDVAVGTRWNEVAEQRGWIVVYPEQHDPNTDAQPDYVGHGNGGRCWNWFRPEHIRRGGGEAATIAAITTTVAQQHRVDLRRVYVLGASAGGAMASVMGATYPDLYAAIGVVAGCGYPLCVDPTGAAAHEEMRRSVARPMPAMVVHGTADPLTPLPLGEQAVQQWLGTADLADDGAVNGSVARTPASREHRDPEGVEPGGGDPCVRNANFPCPGGAVGFQGRYPTTVEHYVDADGRSLVDLWIVHGLMHSYPGGDPRGTFTDPLGPDITTAFADFFAAHPMP